MSDIPKATLYWFPGSVWASVPMLTAAEKGYTDAELEKRVVNLLEGANFAPAYLKINPKGTVPALVAPYEHTTSPDIPSKYKSITDTVEVVKFLDSATLSASHAAPSLSPATVQGSADSNELIALVHKDDVDPNFLLLSARNDEERQAKLSGLPGQFLKGRQAALERYQKEAADDGDTKLAPFYEQKIKENGGLLAIYEGKLPAADLYAKSEQTWSNLAQLIESLETKLNQTYLVGDQISLADLHVGAYFARILAVSGAKSITDMPQAITALESNLPNGVKVGPKLTKYLDAVFARPSFQGVYGEGWH